MVILDVIPMIPLPRSQPAIASYFHADPLPRGTVVRVTYSNRKIKAIVIECVPLADRKLQFKKQASFTLKKIDKVLPKLLVTDYQLQKAKELSDYYFAPLGICIRAVMLHPEEKNFKKYISSGPSLDLPELEKFQVSSFKIKLADMRKEIRDANYSIFSRYLKEALQTYDKLIIFIPRKGYANFLLCKDCGSGIKCPNCDVLLAQHQGPTLMLMCHHCNYSQQQPKTCPSCRSYNLKPYGIGIEKVEAELLKFFSYQNLAKPNIKTLTSETKKLQEDFQILLATQSLFKYRDLLKVPYLAIMNADTLIHIPDYRAEELLLRQTLLLASMTDHLLIQTYNPEDPALVAAANDKVKEFWKSELETRKTFGYPPFAKLIKLTYRHGDSHIAQRVARNVAEKLGGTAYSALISRERGLYVWNVLLKFPEKMMNDKRSMINALPPDWHIDVDPISII